MASGVAPTALANSYAISVRSLYRHRERCMALALQTAKRKSDRSVYTGILSLVNKMSAAVAEAERSGNMAALAAFARELRDTYRFQADLESRSAEASNALTLRIEHVGGVCYKCPRCGEVVYLEPFTDERSS